MNDLYKTRTAKEWYDSYCLITDAMDTHLSQFLFDDDIAEEAIYSECIETIGKLLTLIKWNENDGYVGNITQKDIDRILNLHKEEEI